jgi:hypothetical protein
MRRRIRKCLRVVGLKKALTVQQKPSDYLILSAMCREIANSMPLEADRVHLTDTAQKWAELAHDGEGDRATKVRELKSFFGPR